MPRYTYRLRPLLIPVCLFVLHLTFEALAETEAAPETTAFTYSKGGGVDETLGQIALYLIDRNRKEGNVYTSKEVEEGIVGYRLRYFDNGNHLVDRGDWLGVRRYRIPAEPDSLRPEGYYKKTYMELVDIDLNGIDERDYYFIEGRRFDFIGQPADILQQYQVQIESGISAYIRKVGYQTILQDLGAEGQTAIKKGQVYEDGSLPSEMVLGLDLRYVFRPIRRSGAELTEKDMIEEIRQRIGFVFSATTSYTDFSGFRFRDIADQSALVQRTYDPIEQPILILILDALFDTDADGIINPENIQNGYTRFRELHQQLAENARGLNRRIVLPSDKLARLRQEYQSVHNKPFQLQASAN